MLRLVSVAPVKRPHKGAQPGRDTRGQSRPPNICLPLLLVGVVEEGDVVRATSPNQTDAQGRSPAGILFPPFGRVFFFTPQNSGQVAVVRAADYQQP